MSAGITPTERNLIYTGETPAAEGLYTEGGDQLNVVTFNLQRNVP